MEKLNHFSHNEHPLFLIEDVHQIAVAPEEPICYGCGISIKSELKEEPTYGCRECNSFFLHKRCAELPRELSHPLHPKHPLVLLPQPRYPFESCLCDACDRSWDRFTYRCSSCDFDMCILCVEFEIDILHAFAERGFEHPGHHHPLALQRREALFTCNACGEKHMDQSYLCTTCPFWIHRECALLPKKNTRKDHDHPFLLEYNYISYFRFVCYVCRENLYPRSWVYMCSRCRYFVHLKCFTKDIILFGERETDTEITENENPLQQFRDIEYLLQDPIRLPAYNFDIIIRQFVRQQGCKNGDLVSYCCSQDNDYKQHLPVIDNNLKSTVETMVPEQKIICDCCIESIDLSRSFYECGDCKYFFHSSCLKLPLTIHHPCHVEHPLRLLKLTRSVAAFSRCDVCSKGTNGACYSCESCKFYVDIKCASLPPVITHEAHDHPLYFIKGEPERCSACSVSSPHLFRCEICRFNLDYGCVQLPPIVKHRWDRHALTLSFPPFSDHPDEFWCAMCERQIDPNKWLYHCRECDTSLHPRCLMVDWHRSIKLGRNITVGNHLQHPLMMVCEYSFYSSCDFCQTDLNGLISFACRSCKFYLCCECAEENEINLDHKSSDCSPSEVQDCK